MTKEEIMEELEAMVDNGAGEIEVWEWIEDNTDLDPIVLISELYYE